MSRVLASTSVVRAARASYSRTRALFFAPRPAGVSRMVLWLTGARKTSQLPFITREDLSLVVQKSGPEVDLETTERRIIIPIEEVPRPVVDAFVAAVKAIVFQGAGKSFVAGADIRYFVEKIKAGGKAKSSARPISPTATRGFPVFRRDRR